MSQSNRFVMVKLVPVFLVIAALISGLPFIEAKNAPLSNWMINVTEGSTGAGDVDSCPEMVVQGSTVHFLWISRDKDWKYHINYRRSLDGGITWQPRIELYAAAENSLNNPTYKRLAVTGTTVHVALNSYGQRSTWYGKLVYIRSINNGASFEAAREIFSAADAWHVYDVFVVTDGLKLTIGFRNQCNWCVNNSVLLLNSDDQGGTFISRTAYSTDKGSGWNLQDFQRIGDNIYLIYTDMYAYYGVQRADLYFAASSNAGVTFKSQKISMPSKNGNDKAIWFQDSNYVPKIAAEGKNVCVVWEGLDGDDVVSAFYVKSSDYGATFAPVINLTKNVIPNNEPLHAGQETVAIKGNYVYVAMLVSDDKWYSRIYLRRSIDGGATFQPLQKLTSADGAYGLDGGWWPTMQIDPNDATGAKLHVLWNGPTYCYSGDGGATFSKYALLDPRFSMRSQARPKLFVGADGVVHTLTEGSLTSTSTSGYGDVDIFYRRLTGPATPTTNAAISLGTVEQWQTGGDLEKWDNMQVSPSASINFTTAMTAEAWIKPNRKDQNAGFFLFKADGLGGTNYPSYALGQWRDGKIWAQITTKTKLYEIYAQGPAIANNTWTHVALTYDASVTANNFKVYVNGQLVGSATTTLNLATAGGLLFVGGGDNSSARPKYTPGVVIDELRLWNRALSAADLTANMNRRLNGTESGLAAYYPFDNSTKDITGHGNDGVLMYRETFVDGYTMPLLKKDFIGSWAGQGTYSRNSDTGAWTGMTSATTQVTAGDMDGDGVDDLVGLWAGSGVWIKYSSTGQWASVASSAEWIAVGDLNGDGKDDLVGIWAGSLYIRDSATGAWKYVSSGANMVCAGDMDGDGKDDIVGNWPGYGAYVLYSSNSRWDSLCSSPNWIAVGDLNGDGKADLLGIWGSEVWARDTATGAWASVTSAVNQVAAGDLDGDGKADLIGNWPGNGVWVKYTSTGSWGFLSTPADWIAVGRMR